MKYFFDTEFIEYAPHKSSNDPSNDAGYKGTIDLISIGIVAEDGREYYAIHNGFDQSMASPWVLSNVIDKLESPEEVPRKRLKQICKDILEFAPPKTNPEFYAYFCNYDWVVFCWIFGSMVELPKGYPMFCRDIKYIMHLLSLTEHDVPSQDENTVHNALADARWNKAVFEYFATIPVSTLITGLFNEQKS